MPICTDANKQPLVDLWMAAGKKVILSFCGAGMRALHLESLDNIHITVNQKRIMIVITQAIKITAGTTSFARRNDSPQASLLLSIAKNLMLSTSTMNIAMTLLTLRQGNAGRDQQNTMMSRHRHSSSA